MPRTRKEQWLTVGEVASKLHVSCTRVRQLVPRINGAWLNKDGHWRIPKDFQIQPPKRRGRG